jgi:hypothetical protein
VPEGLLRVKCDYEVAAWWTQVRLAAGPVPLVATFEGWSPATGGLAYFVGATVPGVIVDEYTPSLYGGVPTGGRRNDPWRIGQPLVWQFHTYGFSVGAGLLAGALWGCRVTLRPGVTVSSVEVVQPAFVAGGDRMPIHVPERRHLSYRVHVAAGLPPGV